VFMGAGSMVLAALVLALSNPRSRRSAAIQGVLPLIGIIVIIVSFAA
jgi:putative membrane protein